ncbi:MAG: hypothetical protein RMX96_09190 [Nostoc sp. ChiSLP02]|nr:hypothetical protein [Nostoc sp. DedSLP05]MDZ8101711.1 hypothetical protein [Nostoc sp. DedSLP01]MDZ8185015.1 hypothetical protein [Nostoc sp. ChiSLP02]
MGLLVVVVITAADTSEQAGGNQYVRSFYKVPGAIYSIATEATSSVTMIVLPGLTREQLYLNEKKRSPHLLLK